ncbi:hypothetical protein Zmor_004596 [Zophobas morio]|uniref:Uncharacterized protein n=1 Tax=Zophobas morio TaxID=2755281 RepID=A0AA38MKQ6_9CUCU|nr:hypothetical protein Zmor_004596 [Zophobas morio]
MPNLKRDIFRRSDGLPTQRPCIVGVCLKAHRAKRATRLGMSNIGHWVTGIALIKARDTCGVVIGFRSRSVHRDLTPPLSPPPCFRPVSIFKTLFHAERVSPTKTSQKQVNPRRSSRIICHILMKNRNIRCGWIRANVFVFTNAAASCISSKKCWVNFAGRTWVCGASILAY